MGEEKTNLEYIEDWNENLASELARGEQIELQERHLVILRFARKFFQENMIEPSIGDVIRATGLGKREIRELFPNGPKQISKLAGIPYTGCI